MAYSFGDGFDLYASPADALNGYWNSGGTAGFTLQPGRFAGSRGMAYSVTTQIYLATGSGQNDAVHHIVVAYQQSSALSGLFAGCVVQLYDGSGTVQCCVVFRQDGAIQLMRGNQVGTQVAIYTGAVTATNTWYAFEMEVVVSTTVGAFRVRKNGNTSNDFDSGATLNTSSTGNARANFVGIGAGTGGVTWVIDDFFWRSDASSVAWMGDIRCYTRMPVSDASVQFSRLGGATNYSQISEAQQDGMTTYVYDSTAGHADFYGIASIALTPATTIAVTTRGYMQKSDAGTRTAAAQLKSGASTIASPTLAPGTAGWLWAWRTDLTDPNTSAAWTAAAVNGVTIGPSVVS